MCNKFLFSDNHGLIIYDTWQYLLHSIRRNQGNYGQLLFEQCDIKHSRLFMKIIIGRHFLLCRKIDFYCYYSSLSILGPWVGCTVDCLFPSLSIFSCSHGLICWKPRPGSDVVQPCDLWPFLSSWSRSFALPGLFLRQYLLFSTLVQSMPAFFI